MKKKITITLDEELLERLRLRAKKDMRKLSQYIAWVLSQVILPCNHSQAFLTPEGWHCPDCGKHGTLPMPTN